MSKPEASTDPAWAAKQARIQALEEAAEIAADWAAIAEHQGKPDVAKYCLKVAGSIRKAALQVAP